VTDRIEVLELTVEPAEVEFRMDDFLARARWADDPLPVGADHARATRQQQPVVGDLVVPRAEQRLLLEVLGDLLDRQRRARRNHIAATLEGVVAAGERGVGADVGPDGDVNLLA